MKEDDKFEELVSEALEKGSTFELPHDFADRIVLKIQQAAVEKEAKADRWLLLFGIISMMGAMVYVFSSVKFKLDVGAFTFVKGYWGLVVFGILFVTVLHVIDKRLLKKQESG